MSSTNLSRLTRQLVQSIAPNLDARQTADRVEREIKADVRGGVRREWVDVKSSLESFSRTCRVRIQVDLADALEKSVQKLDGHKREAGREWQGDLCIQASNLPQHIQLLLNLAQKPTSTTHDFAHEYLHRVPYFGPTPDQLLYQEIMSDPFAGTHWVKGYDEEVREGWTDSDSDRLSTEESSQDEDVLTPSTTQVMDKHYVIRRETERKKEENEERARLAKERLIELREAAYWRQPGRKFERLSEDIRGWKEISILGNAASLALSSSTSPQLFGVTGISAQNLQRELLFALSGRSGIIFDFNAEGECSVIPHHPLMRQLSDTALNSVLGTFAHYSSQASHIRNFICDTLVSHSSTSTGPAKSIKTREAFAEACRVLMQDFDEWIATLEASFTMGVSWEESGYIIAAATPLSLKFALEERFGAMLDCLASLLDITDSATLLLNTIYTTHLTSSLSSLPIADTLLWLFKRTAAPTWAMLGDWLHKGMPVPASLTTTSSDSDYNLSLFDDERQLDSEFFIERDRDVSWTDEDFWEGGFVDGPEGWPMWLGEETREWILETGKARGLLRSLDSGANDTESWKPLEQVLHHPANTLQIHIPSTIAEYLSPTCQVTAFHLRRVLDEDCGLAAHLDAIEGLMFMRAYDVTDEWASWLFTQMQIKKKWADFQTLTSSIRNIVDRKGEMWLNAPAIRITAPRTSGTLGPIQGIASIRASYRVPFPLSQLLTPTSMGIRGQILAFLLQIQHAKRTLSTSRTLDVEFLSTGRAENQVKILWRVRHRLSWFIDTLWIFITQRVVDVQVKLYRNRLSSTSSLRAMIEQELEHARRVREFCFMHDKTSELHHHLMRILEMSITLYVCYTAYVADRSVHLPNRSRGDVSVMQNRRRRRRRSDGWETSDDEETEGEGGDEDEAGGQTAYEGISLVELSLGERMMNLARDLEKRVLAIRKGVDGLAGEGDLGVEAGEMRSTWRVLAFALEDWK